MGLFHFSLIVSVVAHFLKLNSKGTTFKILHSQAGLELGLKDWQGHREQKWLAHTTTLTLGLYLWWLGTHGGGGKIVGTGKSLCGLVHGTRGRQLGAEKVVILCTVCTYLLDGKLQFS